MKYNHKNTICNSVALAYPTCLKLIDEIIFKDDDSLTTLVNIFDTCKAIDVDNVEICLAREEGRKEKKTMDLAFSISDNGKNSILLVELKLNIKNVNRLHKNDLMGKFEGASEIFDKHKLHIKDLCIFVFKPHKKQEAISRLSRMYPKIPREYEVLSIQDLKQKFF